MSQWDIAYLGDEVIEHAVVSAPSREIATAIGMTLYTPLILACTKINQPAPPPQPAMAMRVAA